MNNFAVLTIAYTPILNSISITITTNNPRHLTCYYTDKQPGRHKTSRRERGIDLPWGAYFCFVAWKSVEQIEPGDTTTHTFHIPTWPICQTLWFAFRGLTYEYVPTPSGPVLPEDYPFYEPWGATLTENYPWLPFTIPDIPTWTLEEGILTLTNPGFADCGIAYSPPYLSLPLLDSDNQPLRINTDNPDCSINSSSTQIHHELIFRSLTEVMSIYLAIGLGAEWYYYKPYHHTVISGRDCGIYWIGTGHHDLNLYDLFVKFRTLFGKSTDPTGWWLNDIVFVMSLGEEHRTDYLKSNFIGCYHPLPDSLTPVSSPSVSCIFKKHHQRIADFVLLRPNAPGDECFITYQAGLPCPDHYANVADIVPDEHVTTVYSTSRYGYTLDFYNIQDPPALDALIKQITIVARFRANTTPQYASAHIILTIGGNYYTENHQFDWGISNPWNTDAFLVTTDWAYYQSIWPLNPATGSPWTWQNILDLQIGIALRGPRYSRPTIGKFTYCTQLYLDIRYETLVT